MNGPNARHGRRSDSRLNVTTMLVQPHTAATRIGSSAPPARSDDANAAALASISA